MKPSKTRILLTFSSGYGVTREIAEEIARVLKSDKNLHVDCRKIEECETIDDFDVVIIGSSLRADLPLANVRDFIVRFRWELGEKQTALFVVSIASSTSKGAQLVRENIRNWLAEHHPWLEPISIAAFGGKVDFTRINEVMQTFVRQIMKNKGVSDNGSYDARNWQEIRAWAQHLAEQMSSPKELEPAQHNLQVF